MSRRAPPVPAPSSSHARLLSRLKNRHLALLANIDHAGSLTRAAAALGISQPAATKTLAELETIFGAPLFTRAGVRLAPTELGRLAIVRAHHMLQALASWGQEMDTVRAGHRAHLSIGAVPYISDELLANTLTILHREHGIATTLVRATSDQLSTALARHDIDCLIGRYAAQAQSETFNHQLLFEQRPALIAHPSLAVRLTKQTPDWRQLAKMDWILPSPSTPIGTVVTEIFAQAQAAPPVPVVETYSVDVIAAMLRDDPRLISILPEAIARNMVRRGDVGIVGWSLAWSLPPVNLIRRQRDTPLWAEDMLARLLMELTAPLRSVTNE